MFEYAALVGVCTAQQLDYRTCAFITIPKIDYLAVTEFVTHFNLTNVTTDTCAINKQSVTKERSFAFNPEILRAPPNGALEGRMQSWKYFHPHAAATIRQVFVIPQGQAQQASAFIENIRSKLPVGTKLIAVHVRVGDKVTESRRYSRYDQWALSEAYYTKAITLLHGRHPNSALVFFSGGAKTEEGLLQDRQWTKDRFGGISTSVFFDESDDHYVSFKAIGLCDAIVVAHSTFSWWAAYLSDTLEVVAPYHLYIPHQEMEEQYVMEDYHLPWWTALSSNSTEDRIVGWNPASSA
jgi:hypothetical protein